jgi:hypothetical protein
MSSTQAALAEAVGVQSKPVNELCNERRAVTAPHAATQRPIRPNMGRAITLVSAVYKGLSLSRVVTAGQRIAPTFCAIAWPDEAGVEKRNDDPGQSHQEPLRARFRRAGDG